MRFNNELLRQIRFDLNTTRANNPTVIRFRFTFCYYSIRVGVWEYLTSPFSNSNHVKHESTETQSKYRNLFRASARDYSVFRSYSSFTRKTKRLKEYIKFLLYKIRFIFEFHGWFSFFQPSIQSNNQRKKHQNDVH